MLTRIKNLFLESEEKKSVYVTCISSGKATLINKGLIKIKFFNVTDMFLKYTSSRPKMICKNDVFKGFTKFTRKYLCRSLIFKKQCGVGLFKTDSNTGVFV